MNSKISALAISLVCLSTALGADPSGSAPTLNFLSQTYRLGSYNQKHHPTWEYVTNNENINAWTSLVTLMERADAKTVADMDRLSEGIMSTYKSNGGRVLLAKTMKESSGRPFNYMLVAFEEPSTKRYELNFVKIAMGPKSAYVMIYGARITDPKDYRAKAKEFVDRRSAEIGNALANAAAPEMTTLPRRTF